MYRTELTLVFPAKNLYLVEMHQAKPVVPPRCRGIMLLLCCLVDRKSPQDLLCTIYSTQTVLY